MPDMNVNYNGLLTRTYYTFATLPTAGTGIVGMECYITDGAANPVTNFGSTAAGSGTYRARVRCDGSAWKYAGQIP